MLIVMRKSPSVRVWLLSVTIALAGALLGAAAGCVGAAPEDVAFVDQDSGASAPAADSGAPVTPAPAGDGGPKCAAPVADCDGDGVCETSLDTDPKNCGACGRDCGGGACEKGCKPVTLVSGLSGAVAAAVNASALVILAQGGPRVCPKAGCIAAGVPPTTLENDELVPSGPHTLVVDEENAYWLGRQGAGVRFELKKCAIAGCGLAPVSIDEEQNGSELLSDGAAALRYDPTGQVTRVPLSGVGGKQYLGTLTIPESHRFALAGGKVAFSNKDGATGGNRGVWVGAFANMQPTRVMNEGDHVAIAGDVVYASRPSADPTYDAIFSCSFAGCGGVGTNIGGTGPTAGTGRIADMRADASGLYWVESIGTVGRVMHCALPDCKGGPRALAAAQDKPVAITTDDKFVYWVNAASGPANGTVARIAK